jgi:hypothetical protein
MSSSRSPFAAPRAKLHSIVVFTVSQSWSLSSVCAYSHDWNDDVSVEAIAS